MARPEDNTPLGESIGEIVDRTTKIVHEEIELAKAEMSVALQDLLRGSVAGIVGGVFAFFGLFILLIAFSFLVADAVGAWYPWLGFFIVAFLCFLLGGLLAFVALKKIKKGSQIVPTQAIDEAKQTKEAIQAEADKGIETIDSTAVEEATPTAPPATKPPVDKVFPVAGGVKPVDQPEPEVSPEVAEAKEDLKEAREDADELQLDAKEAKRRAKQEAKEAKEAAKAARKAEQEAAKAEAIAAKQAEKAQKEADKARAKAEKEAEKEAKKATKAAGKEPEAETEPEPPAQQPGEPQRYVAPQPPTPPAPPQTPPAPPTSGGPTTPPTPPAPPTDPTENN